MASAGTILQILRGFLLKAGIEKPLVLDRPHMARQLQAATTAKELKTLTDRERRARPLALL